MLVIEAARAGIRVAGVYQSLLAHYLAADKVSPIAGQRWVLGHQYLLDGEQIAQIRDLDLALTLHTNAHIWKRGSELLRTAGPERVDDLVPLRRLLDAGIKVSMGTDNVPITMFGPLAHVVARRDRSGAAIAPSQAVSMHEALECATANGAWAAFAEDRKGRLRQGMLADMVVLDRNPFDLSVDEVAGQLAATEARLTIVGGRVVYERGQGTSANQGCADPP